MLTPGLAADNDDPNPIGRTVMEWVAGPGGVRGPQGLPLFKPPYARITAIDLNTGETLWWIPNGDTPDRFKNHAALQGIDIGNTGGTFTMGGWTHETERYRYATRADIPAFAELLSDAEVGRWLWFTPIAPKGVEAYFGPLLDRQAKELAEGETPRTAVFTVEDLHGAFLGQGAVVAVEASPKGYEIGFQLVRTAWGRGVGSRLGQFLCAYAIVRCDAHRIAHRAVLRQ